MKDGRVLGTVLEFKGSHGWIKADERIDHEEAGKHRGRIFVSISDVVGRQRLQEGERVSFAVYADGDGLGAELVKLEQGQQTSSRFDVVAATAPRRPAQTAPPPLSWEDDPPPVSQRDPTTLRWRRGGRIGPATGLVQPIYDREETNMPFTPPHRAPVNSDRLPGMPLAFQMPPPPAPGQPKWWAEHFGGDDDDEECCPISLTPLAELNYEPFGLLGTVEGEQKLPQEGVWGRDAAKAASEDCKAIHWFDGMFLASYLVSEKKFDDPVNRRPLSRGECRSLDAYLKSLGLPPVHVTDAFDLGKAIANQQSATGGENSRRMEALEREAASMLQSLFNFRSATASAPPPPPPRVTGSSSSTSARASRPIGPRSGESASWEEAGQDRPGPTAASRGSTQVQRPARTAVRRTVHDEGGLTVVDDGEFDDADDGEDSPPVDLAAASSSEPTPAEALARGKAAASRGKATRMPQVPREKGQEGGAQVTFAVTGRSFQPAEGSGSRKKGREIPAEEEGARPVTVATDVWIPDAASPALHERLLEELQAVETIFQDEWELLTPEVMEHLQECVQRGSVSARPDPLRFEVAQQLDTATRTWNLVLEFSLPPYYPLHPAAVTIRGVDGEDPRVLERFQATLRREVISKSAGFEVVMQVVEWLGAHGSAALGLLEQEVAGSGRAQAAPAAAAPATESKKDRIEQARLERLSAKYSEQWTVCYAFAKHGSCKDKNCPWRHELPPSNKTQGGEEPPMGKAASTSRSGNSSGSGSKKPKS